MFELAFCLGMPVYVLKEQMPYEELRKWFLYFEKRPYGWRDDDRAAKIIQAQGVKMQPKQLFSSLAAIYDRKVEHQDGLIKANLKGSFLLTKLQGAIGGDKLDL